MVYISPYKPIRLLINKLNSQALSSPAPDDTPALLEPVSVPRRPSLTNEYLSFNGCKRCGEKAVCALHAKGHDLFPEPEPGLIHISEVQPLAIISNYEQINYGQNEPQLLLKQEDKRKRVKLVADQNSIDVEDGPFCCSNIMILERESRMYDTDPDFPRIRTLLSVAGDPQRMMMELDVVPADRLREIETVYKVNVYGRHVPFDAHSTWLFVRETHDDDDSLGENKTLFYGFMYCKTLQPFSSVKRYVTAGCVGEHKGSRFYRIGIYEAEWVQNGNRPLFGTFGDPNLDTVMGMPVKRRGKRVTGSNMPYCQELSQEVGLRPIMKFDQEEEVDGLPQIIKFG